MRSALFLRFRLLSLRCRLVSTIVVAVLHGLIFSSAAHGICYSTPDAAMGAINSSADSSLSLAEYGYRVIRIETDPILHQRWATIGRCGHPEWPSVALLMQGPNPLTPVGGRADGGFARGVPVVRAGETVQLWRQEELLRIEVAGVSEDNGGVGSIIRVRLLHGNPDEPAAHAEFTGVVRGASSVEIQP
jgi:Chaperone for flagella basal body P-ring formation